MPSQRARFVIPAGQEPVIAQMINPPAGLGDGWRFDRATIRDDSIHAYYQGPKGSARAILRAREDAPPEWPRTERFAVGLAAAKPGPSATALYRAVLAAVRAGESAFAWREVNAGASAFDDGAAERERAAEAEVDLHLDLTPFIDLGIDFDHHGAFAEALALRERFVNYQSDPTYGITGWRGLALQALDGDPTRAATTEEDAGVFQDQSRYRRTEIAALCPITMSLLERLLDFDNCRTVAFLLLEPGAHITPHVDGTGPPVMRSVNVALNMPEGCRLVIDCNPDGSDNPYTHTVPFRDGSVVLMNVAKYHYVVNESPVPRIHVVARGALRLPATRVLARAEAQDNLRGTAAVEAALAVKRGNPQPSEASSSAEPAAPLSPYVSALAGEARDRLLDLVDLGDRVLSARIAAASGAPQEWQGELEVHLPSGGRVALDVRSSAPARPAWFETAHFACSYRTQGTDPLADPADGAFLAALRQRLSRLDPTPPAAAAPAVTSLLNALDRHRPFASVKDEDYRILFQAADHTVGILWLGFGCNQNCFTCWQDRDWPAPPDEVFDRWLDELCRAGIGSLTLSGGEPTLHARLPHWLRRAARAGVHVTLETNAIRFVEPGVLEELRGAGLESVVVSLHSADAAVSDALTQTPNTFALTVAGIRAALAAGLRVGIHCVVERHNFAALEAHARFVAEDLRAGERGVAHVSYSFPIPYRQRAHYQGAIVPLDELRPHLSAAARTLGAAGIDVRFLGTSGFPPCAYDDPASIAARLPETVSAEMRVDHVLLGPCAACSLHARCLGVHKAYAESHGSRGIVPIATP